jgi:hypothetical protein
MMRFYTMASDVRSEDFGRFCRFFFAFNPESHLHVIPFEENCPLITEMIARDARITLVATDPRIDDVGIRVYLDEEYRENVPSWRYFRKFNAFSGHRDPFVFLDANSLVLSRWEMEWYFRKMDERSVFFRGLSKINRTIPAGYVSHFLNDLGLNSASGYNMGGFISYGGVFDPALALSLARPRLRKVLRRAPEQGFFACYMAMFGIENGLMTELEPKIRLKHKDETLCYHKGTTRLGDESGYVLALTKYTGAEYTPHSAMIEDIVAQRLSDIGRK